MLMNLMIVVELVWIVMWQIYHRINLEFGSQWMVLVMVLMAVVGWGLLSRQTNQRRSHRCWRVVWMAAGLVLMLEWSHQSLNQRG
jgi:predicted ABC-type exoprotein transport system permease subunit